MIEESWSFIGKEKETVEKTCVKEINITAGYLIIANIYLIMSETFTVQFTLERLTALLFCTAISVFLASAITLFLM